MEEKFKNKRVINKNNIRSVRISKEEDPVTQFFSKKDNLPLEGEYYNETEESLIWYQNGVIHRDEIDPQTGLYLPAMEKITGTKCWLIQGHFNRKDGGPAVEYLDGTKQWLLNGLAHREDGPAFENSYGIKEWYLNGFESSEEEVMTRWIIKQELEQLTQSMTQINGETKKIKL